MSLLHFILRNRAALDNTYKRHVEHVYNDGGWIRDEYDTKQFFDFALRRNPAEIALASHLDATGYKYGATNGQLSKIYSINREGDLIQATAAAQPVVHEWRGENYWSNQGVAGNIASTPDAPVNRFAGDIDISAKIRPTDWLQASQLGVINKNLSSLDRGISLNLNNRRIELEAPLSSDKTTYRSALSPTLSITSGIAHIRATFIASTGAVTFYTSTDGITWTQVGTSALTAGALNMPNSPINMGARLGGLNGFSGKIFSVKVYNGIRENGGTLAVNFDANDYRKSDPTDQAGWNASITGERWTINTDGNATGIKGVLVDRTMFQTDGVDDNLKTGVMTLNQPVSMYLPVNVFNAHTSGRRIFDGGQSGGANYLEVAPSNVLALVGGSAQIAGGAMAAYFKKSVLINTISNGTISSIATNGVTQVVGDCGAFNNPNGITVGGARFNGSFINALFSTVRATRTADTPGQQADTLAFIQQLNKRLY